MAKKEVAFSPKLIGDILDIIHNAILVIDTDARIIFVNTRTAKMFASSVSAMQDLVLAQLFMPDDTDVLVVNILHLIRREREYEGEAMLRRQDGSTFIGLIAGTFFSWTNGQEGMAFTVHDMTEVKAIEKSFRYSQRIAYLGRIVEDISHQIRNPVMVIGGFARRLRNEECSSHHARAILDEAGRLEAFLDTLNQFIQLRAPVLRRVRISDLLLQADRDLGRLVFDMGCTWSSLCEARLREESLLVDQSLLFQALEALVVNACESYSSGEGRKVELRICSSADTAKPLLISVRDWGGGIPPAELSKVAAHFYTNKTRHTGLGLTFAQRILEEQDGRLAIDSKPEAGTTVSCYLVKERRRPIRLARLED